MVHESKRMVQVFHSKNIASSLTHILSSLEDYGSMKNDVNNLTLVVIQKEQDTRNARLIQKQAIQSYLSQGYNLYRVVQGLVSYKLDKRVIYKKGKHLFELYLVSSNDTKIVLGYFPHHRDLQDFVSKYYPRNEVTRIVKHESLLIDG